MSIEPTGPIVGSTAGTPQAQHMGHESERAQQTTATNQHQVEHDQAATKASVGETQQQREISQGAGDGRRMWEPLTERDQSNDAPPPPVRPPSPDGTTGEQLDLVG